jgi:hypothetical protein
LKKAAGVYAETKIEELAEWKLRFDHSELAQQWEKIQRREREASIPKMNKVHPSRRTSSKASLYLAPENE